MHGASSFELGSLDIGVGTIVGGRAEARSGIVDGNTREATARVVATASLRKSVGNFEGRPTLRFCLLDMDFLLYEVSVQRLGRPGGVDGAAAADDNDANQSINYFGWVPEQVFSRSRRQP